ncbi:hypothetical protein [Streptomyces sp. NRRL S-1521]|uniref:hypothetical protein n=1 Tax=Streptomyces sp. NRRL S-1521 TaxID=1609100 RepID=UPI000748E080|nr:hypothetical protein [Streptomyces sp. NRRL S-1521]KUL52620.1 hypothetical protein ADL30_23120 [Streptomyces sp. NRRL S-1521]
MHDDLPQYANTEATRLLCAGVRLDPAFGRRVVDELVGHAERPVAPALGADVLPVLAHALRARRAEMRTAWLLLAAWAGFLAADSLMIWDALADRAGGESGLSGGDIALLAVEPADHGEHSGPWGGFGALVPGGWAVSYAVVVLLLRLARAVSGRPTHGGSPREAQLPPVLAWLRRRVALMLNLFVWSTAAAYGIEALAGIGDNPYPVVFPLLMAAVVWRHQYLAKRTLRTELARRNFDGVAQSRLPRRYARIAECVRREQRAPLTLYDANRPFIGSGTPRKPWSVVLELRRRDGEEPQEQPGGGVPRQGAPPRAPLAARDVIEMIRPRLQELRTSAATGSRDRLRDLEITEFVCLPAGPGRDEPLGAGPGEEPAAVYAPAQVGRHIAEAAGEGGEARRHFLRLRVGAWDEQVVLSLLVGVHTQGGMLVLEVVPHVLGPIVPEYRAVDRIVAGEPEGPLRDALRACVDAPTAGLAIGVAALRTLPSLGASLRFWLADDDEAAPRWLGPRAADALRALRRRCSALWPALPDGVPSDAPDVSLRELAATDSLSLLQEMDVARYTKTLQDRIGEGVREALRLGGYRTDRLEQHITQITNSGVYIGEMSGGALATGAHGRAAHHERSTA